MCPRLPFENASHRRCGSRAALFSWHAVGVERRGYPGVGQPIGSQLLHEANRRLLVLIHRERLPIGGEIVAKADVAYTLAVLDLVGESRLRAFGNRLTFPLCDDELQAEHHAAVSGPRVDVARDRPYSEKELRKFLVENGRKLHDAGILVAVVGQRVTLGEAGK